MLDDQDGDAAPRDAADQVERAVDLARIEPGVHLVEHQHLGRHGEALGELQPLAAGKRERRRRAVREGGEADEIELRACFAKGVGDARPRAAEQRGGCDVLHHGHARERLHDLEGAGKPAPRRLERPLGRHIDAAEPDAAGLRAVHAGHQVDEGGLAGPVGADQADDLALLETEAHIVDGLDAAEAMAEAIGHQDGRAHAATFGRPSSRATMRRQSMPSRPPGRKKISTTMTAPRMARL